MANSIVQTIREAEIDARSLSEFISKDASFMVTRRLAPTVHTLDYYLNFFDKEVSKFGGKADAAITSINDKVSYVDAGFKNAQNLLNNVSNKYNEAISIVNSIEPTVISMTNDAINNTAVEGGVLADTFVVVDGNQSQRDVNQKTTRKYTSALNMLADTKLKVGQFVETLGYTQTGDGGENKYIIESVDTQVVDNGSFIELSNGLIAKALFPGNVIRPQHFGARESEDSTAEMFYLNKYVNSLNGCTIEFVTDITAQPISWKRKEEDPTLPWALFKAPHILHVPSNSTVIMKNGSTLRCGVLPYRFGHNLIQCDQDTINSSLIDCSIYGAYHDSEDLEGRDYISVVSNTLNGKITVKKETYSSLGVLIPESAVLSGNTVEIQDVVFTDYEDLTGSTIHLDTVSLDDLVTGNVTVTKEGSNFLITPSGLVKEFLMVFYDSNNELQKIKVTSYMRGEWGHGLALRSCKKVTIKNLTVTNTSGDAISIGTMSYHANRWNTEEIDAHTVLLKDCRRQGISINSLVNSRFYNTTISGIKGTAPSAGIDIETDIGLLAPVRGVVFDGLNISNTEGSGFILYNATGNDVDYLGEFASKVYQDITLRNVYMEDTGGIALWRLPYPNKFTIENATIKNSSGNGVYVVAPGTKEGVAKHITIKGLTVDTIKGGEIDYDKKVYSGFTVRAAPYWYPNADEKDYLVGGIDLEDYVAINCNEYTTSGTYGIISVLYNSNIPKGNDGLLMVSGYYSSYNHIIPTVYGDDYPYDTLYTTGEYASNIYIVNRVSVSHLRLDFRGFLGEEILIVNNRSTQLRISLAEISASVNNVVIPKNLDSNTIYLPAHSSMSCICIVEGSTQYIIIKHHSAELFS